MNRLGQAKTVLFIVLCGSLPCTVVPGVRAQTIGNTYYVATNGNDRYACSVATNSTTPKATLNNAVTCLRPGDTLLIRGGTYPEALIHNIPRGVSWDRPVTLQAYPGESVIVMPPPGVSDSVLRFVQPQRYIVIDGLILDGTNAINQVAKITYGGQDPSVGAHHIRFVNSEIKNSPGKGIQVGSGNTHSNEFINVDFHHNGNWGLLVDISSHSNKIIGSAFHHNGSTDFHHGLYLSSSNNLIEANQFYANAGWGIHKFPQGDNNIIRDNIAFRNGRAGDRGVGIGIYGGTGNQVYNNISWGNRVGIDLRYGESNASVFNNTVYGNTNYGIYNGVDSVNAEIRNNIVYRNGTDIVNRDAGSALSNNLSSDPLFIDASSANFRLQDGSPAIDAGVTLPHIEVDMRGMPRPQGSAYDIGAFEWAGDILGGDANADGQVDFADFTILANHFNMLGGWIDGDFDGSGVVDFPDFLLLSDNFGKSATAVAAVPEPNAAMLFLVGLVGLVRRRCIVSKKVWQR